MERMGGTLAVEDRGDGAGESGELFLDKWQRGADYDLSVRFIVRWKGLLQTFWLERDHSYSFFGS
jgi:hypothetical protein